LGANLENLDASQTGTTKLNLTGNALNNTLTGNDADNTIIGGVGNDMLTGGLGADTFKWNLADHGTAGNFSTNSDAVTDFSIAQSDVLNLHDLLIGESAANLLNYLDVTTNGVDTQIAISTTGGFTGGNYNADSENAHITLAGIDLFTATSTSTEADLLNNLLSTNKLMIG